VTFHPSKVLASRTPVRQMLVRAVDVRREAVCYRDLRSCTPQEFRTRGRKWGLALFLFALPAETG
jgi:hypothetical protein